MSKQRYEATFTRAAAGLMAGATFLASIIPVGLLFTRTYDGTDMSSHMGVLLYLAGVWFWVAFEFYLISAALIAVPIWAFCHSRGWRSWRHAMLISALLIFAWTFGKAAYLALYGECPWETVSNDGTLIRPILSVGDWLRMAGGSAVTAAIGCAATLIIWRIAYRRVEVSNALR